MKQVKWVLAGVLVCGMIAVILNRAPAAAQEQEPAVGPCFSDLNNLWRFELNGVSQGPYNSRAECEAARAPYLPDPPTPTVPATATSTSTVPATATPTRRPVQRATATATPTVPATATATPTRPPIQ